MQIDDKNAVVNQENHSSKKFGNIAFWIFILLAMAVLLSILVGEIFLWNGIKINHFVDKNLQQPKIDNITKDLNCNLDTTTWKQYVYKKGELSFSFKYPPCLQEVSSDDDLSSYRELIGSNIDLSKYPKGQYPRQLPFVRVGAAMNSTIQATDKNVTSVVIGGYPAKKTFYKDAVSGKANLIVQTDKIFSFKIDTQIAPHEMPVGVLLSFDLNDANDYPAILDLMIASFKINL